MTPQNTLSLKSKHFKAPNPLPSPPMTVPHHKKGTFLPPRSHASRRSITSIGSTNETLSSDDSGVEFLIPSSQTQPDSQDLYDRTFGRGDQDILHTWIPSSQFEERRVGTSQTSLRRKSVLEADFEIPSSQLFAREVVPSSPLSEHRSSTPILSWNAVLPRSSASPQKAIKTDLFIPSSQPQGIDRKPAAVPVPETYVTSSRCYTFLTFQIGRSRDRAHRALSSAPKRLRTTKTR